MQNAHPGVKLLSDRGDRRPCNGTASHREREGGPAGGGRRKTFKVGDQIKDGPSELALPCPLTPSSAVRLSALGPCLKERKNGRGERRGERARDRSIADGAWRVFRKRDCNNNACCLARSLARSTGEWRTRPEAAAAPAEVSSLGMLIC